MEEFTIPEKWCVKDCEEVTEWARKIFTKNISSSIRANDYLCIEQSLMPLRTAYHFLNKHDSEDKEYIEKYIEITFKQFEKYILNKSNAPIEQEDLTPLKNLLIKLKII